MPERLEKLTKHEQNLVGKAMYLLAQSKDIDSESADSFLNQKLQNKLYLAYGNVQD